MEYQINGVDGVFEVEKLALAVLQDYCSKNECTFNELKVIFPDEVQGDKDYIKQKIGGNTGVFDTLAEAKDREDYFALLDPIKLKDATIVVSVTWGERHLPLFIEKAEAVGYTISTVDSEKGSSSDTKHYTFIKAFNNENSDQDYKICDSIVAQTNGKYTLSFHLDNDGDGVIDTYQFYDIKTKVSALNSSPWDFTEFTDVDEEWTEHESFEDFGYDSSEISETLYNMRLEFIEKYLNEASQNDFMNNAAVPFDKRDILKEDVNSGILVFEEGDKNILSIEL
ncbi:hypothetical protein N8155_00825 [Flavobacteriales bacterium]|nr:hypothetical protein [Flavobacteriales bacterium]